MQAGRVFHMRYEARDRRPFASLVPDYAKEAQTPAAPLAMFMQFTSTSPPEPKQAKEEEEAQDGGSPEKQDQQGGQKTPPQKRLKKSTSIGSISSMPVSTSNSNINNNTTTGKSKKDKPFKRVVMTESDPSVFDEIIVRRTMLLEHLPNVYDKAFERAFETLMMELASGTE